MQYAAVFCGSGKESDILTYIRNRAEELVINPNSSDEIRNSMKELSLVCLYQGYFFIGFKEWTDELYYFIKDIPNVIKILSDWKSRAFLSEDEMRAQIEQAENIKIHVITTSDQEMEMMCNEDNAAQHQRPTRIIQQLVNEMKSRIKGTKIICLSIGQAIRFFLQDSVLPGIKTNQIEGKFALQLLQHQQQAREG